MRCLAVIPARGGSKRIPRKNIKDFCGYPIIKYSISAARESGCFDEVMVSTDDVEIANISLKYKAVVPFYRSKINSSDTSTTMDVIKETINNYARIGKKFDYICCIYPTAPFVKSEYLVESLRDIVREKADSLVSVVRYGHPIQRALRCHDGKITMIQPENMNVRTQDLEQLYHDAGQFYWLSTKCVDKCTDIITDSTFGYEIAASMVQDIDDQEDWILAEIKYERLIKTRVGSCYV